MVNVIGAGLAGCEAAWQLAQKGVEVCLYEMKPHRMTPAHHSRSFAELVCSNSLRSDRMENAVGILKEEMRLLDSLILSCADACRVPAGGALAVDRDGFSALVTERVRNHPLIRVVEEEITSIPTDGRVIIATGPLTSEPLSDAIREMIGGDQLYFYDAAAPIVAAESIDMTQAFRASRYGRGSDYINCAMNRDQYEMFYQALLSAQTAELKGFENEKVFEGCMPIEVMARRGTDTIRFGPLKPVGITNPHKEERPFAVVQLRQDDAAASLYNIVGFQTHLKFEEQKRVFRLIPGLENAEFARFGVMHRNTFLNSPGLLDRYYRLIGKERISFAGQMTGVEGYVESAASGLLAGLAAACEQAGRTMPDFGMETAIGALARYISTPNRAFQPMNISFGIMSAYPERIRDKRLRAEKLAERALSAVKAAQAQMIPDNA